MLSEGWKARVFLSRWLEIAENGGEFAFVLSVRHEILILPT